ncbi:MAG: hypothetical protein QOD26_2916 [Betaproteobacteria bacterium]|jgi:hypothetical protein|nr:hypothetical protein [Betaproteobacteria bacterium]
MVIRARLRATLRVACATTLLLGGCALIEPQGSDAVDRLVAEVLGVARAPAAEQKAALASAQAVFGSDTSAVNRLRLGTLLAVLPPPLRDDARASELLEPLANPSRPGYGRFAALLISQIADRQRLARELERVGRDSERAARERERADKDRDKREEALRQQIEAMQSIERGILERQEKLRRPR